MKVITNINKVTKYGRLVKLIRVAYITTKYTLNSGRLLPAASLELYIPYSKDGWYIGTWNVPSRDVFNLRSMFKTRS